MTITEIQGLTASSTQSNAVITGGSISGVQLNNCVLNSYLRLNVFEKDMGSVPRYAGSFTIPGSALPIGKQVAIRQTIGPYTGKGTLSDEAEMDLVTACASVTSSNFIQVYWNCGPKTGPIAGNIKFNYFIGG